MYSFLLCVTVLVFGYIFYGKYIDKTFAPDDRLTPAVEINDGVDYIPMPLWKVYLIQLLNIAGTGPIFGALSGAVFGPIVYLWIVFGCIFAGCVHDYMCGMLSERNRGSSISELTGKYLGNKMLQIMRVFSVVLLVMCGVVFTTGPAGLLALLSPEKYNQTFWLWVLIIYYFIATFVPIDKVIGKIYPVFGLCLIFMALGVSGSILFSGKFTMPELWNNFYNMHPLNTSLWPFMFITVACGAVSGFHATQSPMMARCIKSEKMGRQVFAGAMASEGIIALIWAAAGVTCYESTQALLDSGAGCSAVVYFICQTTMGKLGCLLAMLGVIICPISSGDTAYRSARLTLADWFKLDQSNWKKRMLLTLPVLSAGAAISYMDYSKVWRYFSWSNQTLAMIALWTASVYLKQNNRNWLISAVPATFMSSVSAAYFVSAPECLGILWKELGIAQQIYYPISVTFGIIFALSMLSVFIFRKHRIR